MHIYASCGLWKFDPLKGWGFAVDKNKRGRVLYMELTSSFEDLRRMAFEDFGIDQNLVELEEQGEPSSFPPRDDSVSSSESSKDVEDNSNSNGYEEDEVLAIKAKEDDSGKSVRFSLVDVVKMGETFQNKAMLKATLEISAMKHNFDYKVVKSNRKLWYIRCKYNPCKWSVLAEGLSGSTYFIIKKYAANHTCAASSMNNGGQTASAKTIGGLIMHRRTCSCGKYDLLKIPCRHAIKAGLTDGRAPSSLTDDIEYPVIPLLDSIREMLARWFFERRTRSKNHTKPLTIAIEKKIDRRINKGKTFLVQPVDEYRFLVRGDTIDCLVDLDRRTCSCGKYNLLKIPCRHAIKAGLTVGRAPSSLTDDMYTTSTWTTAYQETINPIGVPGDSWVVPDDVRNANVEPPESKRGAGRRRKRRYKTVEDKLRSSQGAQEKKRHRCSRCSEENHNRATCDRVI
uniref:SWIM-type domain-containing protein n=1 Tax=Brassica oleracea var. oleracea TaxID=109376 RepID=A0A0D3BJN1_BRAOL